jgi:hypothetical protein
VAQGDIEYKFKIDAYSPTTIPMARLGEYMAEFGKLLANCDSVHFGGLEEGSTVVRALVKFEAVPKVRSRLHEIKRAEAAADAGDAFNRLNVMLREDNAIGLVLAANDGSFTEELRLPGRELPVVLEIGPFSEPATIKARLYRIGGKDETAHAQLEDAAGRTWNGKLSQEQATAMSRIGLYSWFLVRGTARWTRIEDGSWKLVDFRIDEFSQLPTESLQKDIAALRAIEGSRWGDADPSAFIEESPKNNDGVH